MRKLALVVALGLVGHLARPGVAHAETASYAAANRAYLAGHFGEAIAGYEALVAAGTENDDLYYNLGNAYFRTGQLGRAIYDYERALRLDPSADDARFNLKVAREQVALQVVDRLKGAETDPFWVRASGYFSLSELALGVLALDLLFFAGLILLRFLAVGFARTMLLATTVFVAVAGVVGFAMFAGQIYWVDRVEQGIVLGEQVIMREGPDQALAERGELHPGLRVRLIDRSAGWVRVRLANGVDGWIPEAELGEL